MIIKRKIRLLKPILAARPPQDRDGRREFDAVLRGKSGITLPMNLARWEWAFLEARDALEMPHVSVACITPSVQFTVPGTSTYTRSFRRGNDGVQQTEKFECVPSNAVLHWTWVLASSLPPHVEIGETRSDPPSVTEFDDMLKFTGEMLGMSEWGNNYGFGRFTIVK